MLYMGYVGFSVAYAFAVAALLSGQLDAAWARWSRPWTTAAWIFLTLGIATGLVVGLLRTRLGRLVVLGPGGERFVHALAGRHGAGALAGGDRKARQLQELDGAAGDLGLLAVAARHLPRAFGRADLGACLCHRSDARHIHPRFLVAVIGSSLALFAWRAPKVGLGGSFGLLSRESLLLTNNVLLVVACASVLLGTLYPLLIDALGLGKLSVGPPYFDSVFAPLMIPALFLMGVAPFARWKQASFGELARILRLGFFRGGSGRHRGALPVRRMEAAGGTGPAACRMDRLSPAHSTSPGACNRHVPDSRSLPPH
jgi:cytochrome c-type biogenesis protein CcmF